MRQAFQCLRRHKLATLGALLLFAFLLLNFVAFLHARAMTHYTPPIGGHTPSPDKLSLMQKIGVLFSGVKLPRPVNVHTPADAGFPFSVHQFASSDSIQLEAWHVPGAASDKRGDRDLVLIFPGYTAAKSWYLQETKIFHDLGCDVLLVDFRGCGGSSGEVTTIGWSEADDVQAALAYARKTFAPRRCILFGDSMGAAAVLRAIAVHDDVRPDGVILAAPYDRLLSTVEHRFTTMGLPSFPFARLLVFWGGVGQHFSPFDMQPIRYASSVHCPALLLQGAGDPWVRRDEGEAVFKSLASTHKTFVLFDCAGHVPLCGADPTTWTRAVDHYFRSLKSRVP
jgi:alpha-beta hydrolase superfamily lysophospholipase